MKRGTQATIALIGLLYLGLWVQLMLAPESMIEQFSLTPLGIEGLNSLRANVGVIFFSGAIFCFLSLFDRGGNWLLAAAILTGGAAVGRLFSFAVDGFNSQSAVGLGFEVIIIAVFLMAHRCFKSTRFHSTDRVTQAAPQIDNASR